MRRMKMVVELIGMKITAENVTILGTEAFEAEAETKNGNLHIVCYPQGGRYTARVDKPNGTHKWLYQKSEAQIGRALEQVIQFNGRA